MSEPFPITALEAARPPGANGPAALRLVPGESPEEICLQLGGGAAKVLDAGGATLWKGTCADGGAGPAFARTPEALYCALPGGPVLRIAQEGGAMAVTGIASAPVGLGTVGGAPWGIWQAADDAPYRVGPLDAGEAAAIEAPAPDATAAGWGAVLSGCGGAPVLFQNDPRRGFRAHLHEDGAWRELTARGAYRHGLNALVFGAVPWDGGVALAAGLGEGLRAALFGLASRDELLHLRPDGAFDVLSGELRTSPHGLQVPRSPVRSPAMREMGDLAYPCAVGAHLAVALNRRGASALIFSARPGEGLEAAAEAPGRVLDMCEGDGGLCVLHAPGA